jgi:hypothetical protein
VQNLWGDIESWVGGLGGRIAKVAAGMWDGIKDAFRGAIDWIIRGWNGLQFKIPGFDLGPVHFGGFTLGLPDIPPLAKGGIVNKPTLALIGEAGKEAVVPLDKYPGFGRPPIVKVYIGDRELTDIVRVEVDSGVNDVLDGLHAGAFA